MTRFTQMIVLATFLAVGFGAPMAFSNEPAPADQKGKKETTSTKADEDKKKDDKKDMGGK